MLGRVRFVLHWARRMLSQRAQGALCAPIAVSTLFTIALKYQTIDGSARLYSKIEPGRETFPKPFKKQLNFPVILMKYLLPL